MVSIRLVHQDDWQGLYELIKNVDKELVGMYTETHELVEEWINTVEIGIWEVYLAILPENEITEERKKWKRILLPWKRITDIPKGIVGVVTLYADWENELDIEKGEFDIGITVHEAFQRKGIGKKLITFILERGKELEFEKATLWTRIDNEPMQKLALKSGFDLVGKRKKHGFKWLNFKKKIEKESVE